MDAHTRAVLAQMSTDEQKFYEAEPQRSWLAQMRNQLWGMNVTEGAEYLRSNMVAFRKVKPAAPAPTPPPAPEITEREAKPDSTTAIAPARDR